MASTAAPTGNCTQSGSATTPNPNNRANFQNLMMFLCITAIVGAMVQGMAPKKLLRNVPQPILLLLLYLLIGVIFRSAFPDQVDTSLRAAIDPFMIQCLFLPVLMCSELFRLNTRAFFIVLNQLLLLVGPGVLLGSVLTSFFTYWIMPSRPLFSFNMSMAFGGMLATTDPIAVIITVNEMAGPKRLAALVGGESLLNDGTSIVVVTLFLQLVGGGAVSANWLVFFIFNQMLFSILFGSVMGMLSLIFIRIVRNDGSTLVTFVVAIPFLTFVVAAYFFESSGVLSIIPLCIILNEYGRSMLVDHVERIEKLFDNLAFIATGWLYALSGFVVGEVIAGPTIQAVDWASLLVLYIWINVVRFFMIFLFYPILTRSGYGFSVREALLLAFGGLRGAVGLTLALIISAQINRTDKRAGDLIEFFMCGSILLMMINAILCPVVLRWLKLETKPNPVLMEALQQKMAEECSDTLQSVGVEYDLAQYLSFGASSQMIRQSRRKFELNLQEETPRDDLVEHRLTHQLVNLEVLIGQRKHLVKAQRQMYEQLLKRKLITRAAWYLLDRAADAQLEVNHFHLEQFSFVVDQGFKARRFRALAASQKKFYSGVPGKLLMFLKSKGATNLDEIMRSEKESAGNNKSSPHIDPESQRNLNQASVADESGNNTLQDPLLVQSENGDDEFFDGEAGQGCLPGLGDVSRTVGVPMTSDEWVFTFACASWGFIIAQQDSSKLVDEMFTVAPSLVAFSAEREALKVEIEEACTLPAQFIDACAKYFPRALQRLKSLHALSEAGNRLFGCVATLASHGLIERMELKKLLRFAEKGLKRIRKCEFELTAPITVGHQAKSLKLNPNFFPFPQPENPMGIINRPPSVPIGGEDDLPSTGVSLMPRNSFPDDQPLHLDSSATATSGVNDFGIARTGVPTHGGRRRQSSIRHEEGSGLTKTVTFRPMPNHTNVVKLARRRSFGDFNEVKHCLVDGTEATFLDKPTTSKITAPQQKQEGIISDMLVTSSMHPVDVTKLRDALKLDDAELKRF